MNNSISNKDYPVDFTWTYKKPLSFLLIYGISTTLIVFPIFIFSFSEKKLPSLFLFLFLAFPLFVEIMVAFIIFVIQSLMRSNFSYSLEEDFIIFHQGVITKQQKNLPYGVIQDLIVTQDIFDRIFNTASLIIENAASSGGLQMAYRQSTKYALAIGFYSNTAIIPGLSINNALKLKEIILNKIKTKSFNDNGSGL